MHIQVASVYVTQARVDVFTCDALYTSGRVITLGLTLTPPFYVPKETGHLTLTPQVRRCLPVPVDSVALDPQALIERVWLGKEGSHYILEWVTVVPCLYDLISRETDKEKSYFYPVKVANDRVKHTPV